MKKTFLMMTTVLFSFSAQAQNCSPTPECATLGYKYTAAQCGNHGIKCPTGDGYYCSCAPEFKYSCTSSNETAAGSVCAGKYRQCNCNDGTEWDNVSGICRPRCQIGWIYYADGTCTATDKYNSSKTALGVVVYVTERGLHGQVISLWPVDKNGNKGDATNQLYWSTEYINMAALHDFNTPESAATDYNSCSNTDKILAQGNASSYPAAWAARKYAPTSETNGKWCLPAAGILSNIYINKSIILSSLNYMGNPNELQYWVWSSTETGNYSSWLSNGDKICGLISKDKNYSGYIRPVLEF